MAMVQWDTTTMTMATDADVVDDDTSSCEVAARQEAEAARRDAT
jgi:hypothetical protein